MKTKSLLLVAIMAIFACITASAQNYRNSRYYNSATGHLDYTQSPRTTFGNYGRFRYSSPYTYVGLRIGPAFSTISSDDYDQKAPSTRTGLNIGFAAGVAMSRYAPLYFESGLYYTQKGGKSNDNEVAFNLDYLEVPFTLKYIITPSPHTTIQPYLGGYLACGVNGKIKDYDCNKVFSAFNSDVMRRFDGGLKVGCGISYDMLYAEIAYEYGLANISQNDLSSTHNSSLMLNVGLNF